MAFILGATPVLEVRGAIPLSMLAGLSPLSAIIFAFLGSTASIVVIAPLLYWFGDLFASRSPVKNVVSALFAVTRKRHAARFERTKALALFSLVAIPLPLTGAWSGILAGYVFGFSLRQTILLCTLGTFAASVIVGILSTGARQFLF